MINDVSEQTQKRLTIYLVCVNMIHQSQGQMIITKVTDPILKSEICNSILRRLPLWFGIESAIVDYVRDCQTMDTWVIYNDQNAIGFLSINKHFPTSAEIHVMGILEPYHRQGLGYPLLK